MRGLAAFQLTLALSLASSLCLAKSRSASRNPASIAPNARVAPSTSLPAGALSAENLFRRFKPAVVKILIRQQRVPIGTGTGFFVSPDGKLVTNHHVVKSALKTGSFAIEFALDDGTVVRDFLVGGCRDERGIDLCLLKLPVKPKSWFTPSRYKASPGETVYTIGHPQGLDFSITNGIVSALRESLTKVQELQISAPISPGNSGGPVFNSFGTLVGVASKFHKDGQNLNFGIQAGEVSAYLSRTTRFITIARHRQGQDAQLQEQAMALTAREINPAYTRLARGRAVTTAPGFHEAALNFGDHSLNIPLPNIFDGCRKTETRRGATAFQCSAPGNTAVFSVTRIPAAANAPLMELDGKRPVKSKPLPIVELLQDEGSWTEYQSNLSAENRKFLFSIPSEAECQKLGAAAVPRAAFAEPAVQCHFSIYNDLEPDAYSYSVWAQRGAHIYGFYVWMEDAGMAGYFSHIPKIAVLGSSITRTTRVTRTK